MLRRVCSKHTHHVQISHSQACPCDRPVYAPQLSSYFLHKGRRRPRQKYLRENTIRPSSFLTSYPGLTVRNINCQYRLHSAGAAFSTFSDLHARSSASTSTDDHESGHIKRNNRTTWPTDLPQQLMFLFSDLNLRNNKHARSTLIDDQYLPLKELLEIKSIKNITSNVDATTGDPAATVMDAIDLVNKNVAHTIKLHTEQLNNGDIIVRRSPPFRYSESIHNHHERMMVIEGWAHRPRWALSHIRMMLSNDTSVTGGSSYFDKGMHTIDSNNTPMTYWRYDHALRVLNIEFKSDNGALAAWVNLERAASSQEAANSLGIEVYRLPSEGKAARKAYKLQIGETVLIARSIDLPTTTHMTDFILFDPSSNIPHQDSIITKTPVAVPPPGYNKIWETNEMPTLSQFTDAMNKLYQYHISLAPSVSGDSSDEQLLSRQQDLYADVLHLVSSAKASMDQGEIRALRGKDGYALSDLLSRAMLIYSETPFEDSGKLSGGPITPFDACVDVLHMLRELNLDINPSHYTHALRAACNESRWREASRLFLTQVDGDGDDEFNPNATGGYVPIDPELAWEGLYAVACDSKSSDSTGERTTPSPSKRVFDTAMKMSMISPSSQERYILAAGVALGRAGLWRECLLFASDSESVSTYGPVIAAAAMLACIECTRHTEAISAYDLFMSGNQHAASEWQWGGGNITAVKPLCRDLALHAMGKIESGGLSHDAMSLFGESINEGSPLSTSAVLGLALCLEYDGDWQSSIKYLKGFVEFAYRQNQSSWHVITDVMGRATGDNNGMALTPPEENNLLADLLASAMRVCNQQGQHGLGILLCSITNTSYIGELRMNVNNKVPCAEGEVVNAIASQPIISENKQVLEAFVHCLHGLGCSNVAEALLTTFQYDNSFPLPHGSRRSEATHAESWMHAYIAIDRVLKAMDAIRSSHDLPPEDRILLERGLSRAMSYCIDSNQPAAALELFHYASTVLEDRNRTLTERVRLFFGIDNSYGDNNISGAIFHEGKEIDLTKLRLGDALLAAVIKSYNNLGESEKARSAFLDGTLNSDDTIPQSANNTLEALLDIDIDECIKFLDSMDMNYVNPTTFYLIARRYAQTGSWPEVGDIYNRARNAGCISEELGLIAMQAVVEAELSDGKITVLRRIIDDLCGLVGMESNYWIRSRYWGIKKRVGFHYARLLMKWNDPSTSQKEELLFAVNEIRQCSRDGTVAKHAPLMCIVKIAQLYDTDGRVNEGGMSEKQKQSAINLILEACEEARRSGLIRSHSFTAEAARSLRSLKANKECVKLVRSLLSDAGSKVRHRIAMVEGIRAASEERDHDSLQLLTNAFERSGYDPRRLSLELDAISPRE